MSVAQRAERLGEMRIYIEPETPATVGLHGGARANSRQREERRGTGKRLPPEGDVSLEFGSRVQPFLPFGKFSVLE